MDLTGRQLRVLMKLYKDGPASMHEIGEWIGVSPSSSTSFVDRLADRGLVERVRRQLDRRVIEAGLTAVGRELIDRLVTADFEAREEILSGLSTAELTDLRRLVRRLIGVADEVARARARGEASGPG
jgi:DNA-binding MarR family transcriptional regulator